MLIVSISRAHEDLERYQELIHENDYFIENPEMYDEYLKLHPYQNDWSVRDNKENSQFELANKGRIPSDVKKPSLTFPSNKNHKPSIKISPMIIR